MQTHQIILEVCMKLVSAMLAITAIIKKTGL